MEPDRASEPHMIDKWGCYEGRVVGKPGSHMKKNEIDPYLKIYTMRTSRLSKDLQVKGN